MGLLNIIRRMALGEKQPIREISRRTGLSRNTIAKYLSAGTIEPTFTDLNSVAAVIVLPTDRHKV
jgi:transcriptional regulator with XRE-family HTH domain